MLNKYVKIYCRMEDNLKVQKVVENYVNRGVMMIEADKELVRISFDCSIFKVNKLIHDVDTLNNIGIKTEIKGA